MDTTSRTRAWRRAQRRRSIMNRRRRPDLREKVSQGDLQPSQLAKTKVSSIHAAWKSEKQWKFLWRRRDKLFRAKQLKSFYPRKFWLVETEEL